MKNIEKITLIFIFINIAIWLNIYWEKLFFGDFVTGIISILIAYVIIYTIIRAIMNSYAEVLLEKTVTYFKKTMASEILNLHLFFMVTFQDNTHA